MNLSMTRLRCSQRLQPVRRSSSSIMSISRMAMRQPTRPQFWPASGTSSTACTPSCTERTTTSAASMGSLIFAYIGSKSGCHLVTAGPTDFATAVGWSFGALRSHFRQASSTSSLRTAARWSGGVVSTWPWNRTFMLKSWRASSGTLASCSDIHFLTLERRSSGSSSSSSSACSSSVLASSAMTSLACSSERPWSLSSSSISLFSVPTAFWSSLILRWASCASRRSALLICLAFGAGVMPAARLAA
mmetsp:Transcript_103909/g.276506  ORF Transcript_103909/g.276506 Transcript_103909/m.276506 type:complete len:246 (-) Transcript_103909:149-886(-)